MLEFLKKNIFIIILSSITLFIGFLTFLTFIDRSFIELNQNNLQYLLIVNIFLPLARYDYVFSAGDQKHEPIMSIVAPYRCLIGTVVNQLFSR